MQQLYSGKLFSIYLQLTDYVRKIQFQAVYTQQSYSITFDITTVINNTVVLGRPIENEVTLNYVNPHEEGSTTSPEPPVIATGGHRFKKSIDTATGAGLAGAEFVILNPAGEYIIQDPVTLAVTFTTVEADATRFISGTDGLFEVLGLAYGNYTLVEVVAPDGYALPTNPNKAFVVSALSYWTNPTELTLVAAEPMVVVNKAITIPQTGGPGTILFTIVGAGLMVVAVLYYRRTGKEQEEAQKILVINLELFE